MIYLDNAATSYYRPACVKEAVCEAMDAFGNPSRGAHGASLQADRCLFETRMLLSDLFHADGPERVAFTMNATQALDEALFGIGLEPGDHLVVSLQEHNSILRPAYRLQETGVKLHFVQLKSDGTFDTGSLEQILKEIRGSELPCGLPAGAVQPGVTRTTAAQPGTAEAAAAQPGTARTGAVQPGTAQAGVAQAGKPQATAAQTVAAQTSAVQTGNAPRIVCAFAHGSNVTGNVIELRRVSELVHRYGGVLILDAAQTAGIVPVDMQKDDVDLLCFSGHKALMGPQGTGAIIVKKGMELCPLLTGGSGVKTFDGDMPADMPARLEAGTQNAHAIAGLRAALKYAEGKREEWAARAENLRREFLDGLQDASYRGLHVHIYGNPYDSLVLPTVSFNIEEMDAGDVADALWEEKEIAVRAGGHCAPLIHRFFRTEQRGIVRVSFSHANTSKDVEALLDEIRSMVRLEDYAEF